jgi:hypothetical protein
MKIIQLIPVIAATFFLGAAHAAETMTEGRAFNQKFSVTVPFRSGSPPP